MYCSQCGNKIPQARTAFCPSCGKAFFYGETQKGSRNNRPENITDPYEQLEIAGHQSKEEEKRLNEQVKVHNAKYDLEKQDRKQGYLIKGAGLIAFVVAGTVVRLFLSANSLQEALATASNEINKKAPTTLDSVTELTSSTYSGSELDYHYKITSGATFTQSDLDGSLKSSLIQKVCNTSQTRNILYMGATLGYMYYDSQGLLIGKLSVSSSDCT